MARYLAWLSTKFHVTLTILHILMLKSSTAIHVEVFEQEDFAGKKILETSGTPDTCHSPVAFDGYRKRSITTDSCTIIFSDVGCQGWSTKIMPPSASNLTQLDCDAFGGYTHKAERNGTMIWETRCIYGFRRFESFRTCNGDESGAVINVDTYKRDENYRTSFKPPQTLKLDSFQNLRSCQNVPRSSSSSDISIDNHHHPIKVYSETNCGGLSKVIPPGHNVESFDAAFHSKGFKGEKVNINIKSIAPVTHQQYY